jgi:hypothetical protein
MFNKILIFILGIGLGILVMVYHRWFVRTVGVNAWAERVFGGAGTYTMWQLIGFLIVVVTILYSFGGLERVGLWLTSIIGGA